MYRVGLLLGAALAAVSGAPTDSDLRTRAAVETAWESLGTLYDTYLGGGCTEYTERNRLT